MSHIVIGGGSGNIGSHIVTLLRNTGHHVTVISRFAKVLNMGNRRIRTEKGSLPQHPNSYISWKEIKMDGLPLDTDVVINLAGQNIGKAGLWDLGIPGTTTPFKRAVTSSRIDTTTTLREAIERAETPPKLFISASAVGFYPCNPNKVHTESDTPSDEQRTFFTDLCKKWEDSSKVDPSTETRVVNPRLGVVLTGKTPPIPTLLRLSFQDWNLLLGSGDQPFPWIHMSDVMGILQLVMNDERISGPLNCVAPDMITNKQLTEAVAATCHSNTPHSHVPSSLIRLLYGAERADNLLLDSPQVSPEQLISLGYKFQYDTIGKAVKGTLSEFCEYHPLYERIYKKRTATV